MHQSSMPTAVRVLGYGGLIPFIAFAVLSNIDRSHEFLFSSALLLYGAVILSFVGAIHWGVAMLHGDLSEQDRQSCYIWSVVPALIGWATYILSPAMAALVLILGFQLQYWRDVRFACKIIWPSWYLPLRIRLTLIAIICLLLGIFLPVAR